MDDLRFIAPNWLDIHEMLKTLSRRIVERGLIPDIILGTARGGLIPAVILADLLGLDMDVIGVKLYRGIGERGDQPHIVQDVSARLSGKTVLLVDDVADTGHTLMAVKDYLQGRGVGNLLVCTLHYKEWSIIKPDIYLEETKAWIIYPWERTEAFLDIIDKMQSQGLSEGEMKEEMIIRGIPKCLVEEMFRSIEERRARVQ